MKKKLLLTTFILFYFLIPKFNIKAANETFSTGSYIINMGITPQTAGNGLKPYGLIYDLMRNHFVPIKWVISQSKAKDGTDFTYNGVAYKGGTFIIPLEYRTPAVNAKIATWNAQGVVGTNTNSALIADVTQTLTAIPRWTLDDKNGSKAEAYLIAAGITNTTFPGAYSYKAPASLTCCDDLYVMPHADPIWATHGRLFSWNLDCKGSIWSACHATSALENMVNPADRSQQTNFLTKKVAGLAGVSGNYALSNSLILWGSHSGGSVPYIHQYPNDPIAQYMGPTDAAHQNGSEQINVPNQSATGGWNSTAKIIAYDPTQANVPTLRPDKSNAAAVIVYDKGFGDPDRGYVMYEPAHSHAGTAPDNIAAQRVFLNFSFFQVQPKAPQIATTGITSGQTISTGGTITGLNATATSIIAGATFNYLWSSTCGGIFSNATGAITNFTAPVGAGTCVITCKVTDNCGRVSFSSTPVTISAGPPTPVPVPDVATISALCGVGSPITKNVLTNDTSPGGLPLTLTAVTGAVNGTVAFTPNGDVTFTPDANFVGPLTLTYTVCNNDVPTPVCVTNANSTLTVSLGSVASPSAAPDAVTIAEDAIATISVLTNDAADLTVTGITVQPTNGKVSVNPDNTITYVPNPDFGGPNDVFTYQVKDLLTGGTNTATVTVTVTNDACDAGTIQGSAGTTGSKTYATSDADALILNENIPKEQGTCTTFNVDANQGVERTRSLLQFSLSTIPAGATITASQLRLVRTGGNNTAQNIGAYRMTGSWSEGTLCNGDATLASNGATWLGQNFTTQWLAPGGDFVTTDGAVTAVSTNSSGIGGTATYGWNVLSITQGWYAGTFANNGFMLKDDLEAITNNNDKTFGSLNNGTAGNRPVLRVTYTPSGGVAAVTVDLQASQDTRMIEGASPKVYGNKDKYAITEEAAKEARLLVKFNTIAADIPSGSTITSATFKLTKTGGNNDLQSVGVYQATKSWNEAQDDNQANTALLNGATWSFRDFTTPWTLPGGDFTTSGGATTDVSTNTGGTGSTPNYNWNVLSIVQNWVKASPDPNNGFLVKVATGTLNKTQEFGMRENSTPGNRPTLTINYTLPAVCDQIPPRAPLANPDNGTTPNGVAVNIPTVGNDVFPIAGAVTYAILTPPASGTATIDGAGVVTYTPAGTFNGTRTLSYEVTHTTSGLKDQAVVFIDITGGIVNANDDSPAGANSGLVQTINVKANDTHPDIAALTAAYPVTIVTPPANGSALVDGTGQIVYTPNFGFTGVDVLTYQVCSPNPACGSPSCDIATLNITVLNQPPVANDDVKTIPPCLPNTINLGTNDTDPEGNALTFAIITSPPTGILVNNLDGTATFTPAPGTSGDVTFTYSITDNGVPALTTIANATVTVTVFNPTNTAPVALDDEIAGNINEIQFFSVLDNDSDPESQALTLPVITIAPVHGTAVVLPNGLVEYTPFPGYTGTDVLTYQICDVVNSNACTLVGSLCDIATLTFTINKLPIATDNVGTYTPGSASTPILITANDIDGSVVVPSTVSFTTTGTPLGSVSSDGKTLMVPGEGTWVVDNLGNAIFTPEMGYMGNPTPPTYNVKDAAGNTSNEAKITLSADPLPVATNDVGTYVPGSPSVPLSITGNDTGGDAVVPSTVLFTTTGTPGATLSPDGKTLTVPTQGVWTVDAAGNAVFTPFLGYTGSPTPPTYTVKDAQGNTSNEAIITLTADPLPIATNDAGTYTPGSPSPAILITSNDVTGDTVDPSTILFTTTGSGGTISDGGKKLTVLGQGVWTVDLTGNAIFTPEVSYTGNPTPPTYTVKDAQGNTSNEAIITLTADPLPIATNDVGTYTPGSPSPAILITTNDITGDVVVPSTILFTTTGTPTGTVSNAGKTLTVPGQGVWTVDALGFAVFTPASGYTGNPMPPTYTVKDAQGNTSNEAIITLTADPLPIATNDVGTYTPGSPSPAILITTNDITGDVVVPSTILFTTTGTPTGTVSNAGKTLTVPGQGVWTVDALGNAVFTPASGYTGNPTPPTYTVKDAQGNTSNEAVITITTNYSTDPDLNAGLVGTTIPGDVSTNDEVPAGTTYGSPVEVGTNPNDNLPVIASDGSYTFTTPLPGVYVFNVPVCPPGQSTGCPTELLTITVTDPAITTNPPVANPDITTTPLNTPVTILVKANDGPGNPGGVLGTPTLVGTDGGALNGTVTFDGSGNPIYTPDNNFSGVDVFTYEICETPGGLCATTTVEVTILPANAPNTTAAADDYDTTTGTTPATGNLKTNDKDPEGNPTTVTPQSMVPVTGGIFSVDAAGAYTFTPTAGFVGTVDIPYTICDNVMPVPACTQATLHIVVSPAPVTDPDLNAGLVGTTIPGDVSTNDEVPAGTTYGSPVEVGTNPNDNLPVIASDGSYTFTTPLPGVYVFNVPVCPPGQSTGCPTELLTITVTDPAITTNPPVANPDITTTPLNTPVTILVKANDGPGNPGGVLGTPTLVGTDGGALNGTVTFDGSGNPIYTPDNNFSGVDVFTYEICETPGGLCATTTVEVTILPANAPNTTAAADDYDTTTGTTPATGNLKTNDKDPEGNPTTVTPQSMVPVTGGIFSVDAAGAYTFTPTAGFVGTVDIPYTICDNVMPVPACTQATLHIVVSPAPVTDPDLNAGLVGTTIPGDVSTNDEVPAGTTYGSPVEVGTNPNDNLPVIASDGSYTFTTPLPGVYVFNVPVCPPGQSTGCPTELLTITVTDPAITTNPPVANPDITTTPLNTPVTILVKANDGPGNPGGVLGTPTLVGTDGGALNGTVTFDGSGNPIYTPDNNFSGVDVFTYEVCETPGGLCATTTVEVTILPANAPNTTAAADDYDTTTGTTPATGNLKTNDKDPEGNPTTVTPQSMVPVTGGIFSVDAAGAYTFTPTAGFVGTVDIPYTICDNVMPVPACTQATLHIVVSPAPVTDPDLNAGLVGTTIPGDVSTNDEVPAGTTYGSPVEVGTNPNDNLPVIASDGSYTFTTPLPGVYVFNVPVCPPGQSTGCPTELLTITVTDPAITTNPPVANPDITTTPLNTPVTILVKANDGPGNPGGVLGTPTLVGTDGGALNGTVTFDGSGNPIYTPDNNFSGVDVFTYEVCETPGGLCATTTVEVTILPANAPNTTAAADDYDTTTGTTPATGNLKTNDKDPEGNPTTVTPQSMVPVTGGIFSVDAAGAYTFTPTAGFVGTVDIPYTICDNVMPVPACTQATLHIVVSPAPVTDPDLNAGLVGTTIPGDVSTNDEVPAGTTYGSPVEVGTNPNDNLPVIASDGSYTFTTPLPGVYVFNVPVCPPGQSTGCPTELLTITVTDPTSTTNPPVANPDITTTPLNTPVTILVKANDGPGNPGGVLGTPTLVGTDGGALNGTVTFDGSGNPIYTPDNNFSGVDVFTYEICETPGGLCATTTVEVTILPANAPNTTAAADDYDTTTGTTPATGNLKTNDKDPEGNPTTVTPQSMVPVTGGIFSVDAAGAYTFTPTAGFVGTVDIPYTICDNVMPVPACTQATLHIVVSPAPVTDPDLNAGLVGTTIPGDVSTNDEVPAGTTYGSPVEVGTNPNDNLPVIASDGSYTFTTPLPGVYVFNVPVCPPGQSTGCPTELLTITVTDPTSTTNPPVANPDITTTPLNTPVTILVKANDGPGNPGGVLGTPTLVGTDGGALNGTVTFDGSGNPIYTPDNNFSGVDVFTYEICETPGGLCATTTVEVTILPANAPNTTAAADDYDTTTGTTPATGNLKTNDKDPEGNPTTVTPQSMVPVTGGIFSVDAAGAYTFTPTAGFVGTVDIPYTICDNVMPVPACTQATLHIVTEPCLINIGGIVYIDNDGLPNINGTKLDGSIYDIYMTLWKDATKISVVKVDNTGNYLFENQLPGEYKIVIGNVSTGSSLIAAPQLTSFTFVGEGGSVNSGVSNGDGSPDGKTTITVDCITIAYENAKVSATASYLENDFGITNVSLPVDLVNFNGKQIVDQINLTWKTANEKDFSHFELERSVNLKEFGSIATVKGNNSNIYNHVDTNPIEGINYYRLKMVDLDGTFRLSKVVSVNFEKGGAFISVENPANNGEFKVMTNLKNPKFTLLNSLGQVIDAKIIDLGANNFAIKAKSAAGVYYLNILSNGKLVTKKVMMP